MDSKPVLKIDRRKVRKHWGKTDSEVEEHIEELKKWIETSDKSYPEMPTDHMIEFFLTNCKYDIEKTKTNIDSYYAIRKLVPEVYECSNPKSPEMEGAWDLGCYIPLPKAKDDLYRISVITIGSNSKFNCFKYMANIMNVYEIRICEDLVLGEICIIDYNQFKWHHIWHFSPHLVKKMIFVMENLAKSRIKQFHVIQAPSYVGVVMAMAKKFMKKKIADRVHKNIEDIYDFVPKKLLPKDYGGKQPALCEMIDIWKDKLDQYQDRFDMWENTMQD